MEQLSQFPTIIQVLAILGIVCIMYLVFRIILNLKIVKYAIVAHLADLNYNIFDMIMTSSKKVSIENILNGLLKLKHHKIEDLNKAELEAEYLAGGNVLNFVDGIVYAKTEGLELDYKLATKIDLKNRNIIDSIKKWKQNNPDKLVIDESILN